MLKKYTFLFAILLSVPTVFSQIIYTDVTPDTVLTGLMDVNGDSYFLDMDNNGTDDYQIAKATDVWEFGYIQAGGITPQSNELIVSGADVIKLNAGDPIDAGQTFDVVSNGNFTLVLEFMSTVSGLWAGATEGYMGVRFDSVGTTYYGWVRMAINAGNTEVTIMDYAYQSNGGPINAGEIPPTCIAPTGLMSASITSSSADLSWTENNSATEWQIEYGTSGFVQGSGTLVNTTNNPNTVPGLTDDTAYDYYVRSICGVGDTSDWTGPASFQTLPIPCLDPTNLMSASITISSADLSWTENNGATEWQIEYGTSGFGQGSGTLVNTTNNPNTVSGLTDNTSYDYYVRSICSIGDTSNWAGPESFQTLIDDVGFSESTNDHLVSVFPNPNTGQFAINVMLDASVVNLTIYNLLGEAVFYSKDIGKGNNEINLSFLQNGSYVYRLTSADVNAIGKIVIQK